MRLERTYDMGTENENLPGYRSSP